MAQYLISNIKQVQRFAILPSRNAISASSKDIPCDPVTSLTIWMDFYSFFSSNLSHFEAQKYQENGEIGRDII